MKLCLKRGNYCKIRFDIMALIQPVYILPVVVIVISIAC